MYSDPSSIRVCVLGDDHTGKSSLIASFLGILDSIEPSIADVYQHFTNIGGSGQVVEIQDTLNDSFTDKTSLVKNADVIILVYSIAEQQSFSNIELYLFRLRSMLSANSPTPVVLIGNKTDIEDHREVLTSASTGFDQQHNIQACFETSVVTRLNVQEAFNKAIELGYEYKRSPGQFYKEKSPEPVNITNSTQPYMFEEDPSLYNRERTITPGPTSTRAISDGSNNNNTGLAEYDNKGRTREITSERAQPTKGESGCCVLM